MNYAQIRSRALADTVMKTTEINMLGKLVADGETRPLTAADLALLLRVRFALQTYQAETGQPVRRPKPGKLSPERVTK